MTDAFPSPREHHLTMSSSLDPRLRTVSNDRANEPSQPQQPSQILPRPPSVSSASQPPNGPALSPYPSLNVTNSSHPPPTHYPLQSGEDNALSFQHGQAPAGDPNDPKRPRACEACRGLKVKCDPDPSGEGPCKRCKKANRVCQITQPSRKRQKKTDTRVADLEKKIEILQRLTANINPNAIDRAHLQDNSPTQTPYTPQSDTPFYGRNESSRPPPPQQPGSGNWPTGYLPDDGPNSQRAASTAGGYVKPPQHFRTLNAKDDDAVAMANKANEVRAMLDEVESSFNTDGTGRPQPQAYSDVIDRGQISSDIADQLFSCYVDKMAPHFPAVIFPVGTHVPQVRRQKPILFLAILAAAAGPIYPELQLDMTKELMDIYANRIIVRGEKSLEIVQALVVSTLWYYPPEHFEELKFYQLVHIAAVMAIDIGLGKSSRSQPNRSGPATGYFYGNRQRQSLPDSDSVEARRAWLACYFLCCNTSMGLRRPNLIRWSNFMTESLKVLETSSDAVASDKHFCAWIRSQHIAEEVGYQFSMDDPFAKVSIADDKTHYALKKFENDLAVWRQDVPIEARSNSLEMTGHIVSLYMHEIAMHVDHNVDDFKPPYHESTIAGLMSDVRSQPLTTSHVEALSACLTAIDGVFEVFLKHSIDTVRCLPVANFVRVAYATVVLIKMSLAASNPESNIGKIFVSSNLKAEEYLDGLLQIFQGASADHKSRPSAKFLMVLMMLKTWFQRRLQSTKKPGEATESTLLTDRSDTQSNQQDRSRSQSTNQANKQTYNTTNNTPLDVLSDVAASSSNHTRSHSVPQNLPPYQPPPTVDWSQQAQQMQNIPTSYPMNVMSTPGFNDALNNMDASMSNVIGDDYLMGSGLEQAMGMTLAGFGAYVGDDSFFLNLTPGYDFTNGFTS